MAEDEEVVVDNRSKNAKQTGQDLDKVTDFVEEKEMNKAKVQEAMNALAKANSAKKEADQQREKELAAVKVSAEDVAMVAEELELDKKAAERKLREAGGDVEKCFRTFVNSA